MSVTLLDIWRAARVRSVPFSGESAGYVVLALCEETRGVPRALELADVELLGDGGVRLISAAPCSEAQGEKQLRALLSRLLEVASSPGPSLWRAAGRAPAAGVSGLAAELQKALIPFNRAAARRALLRLFRETERAVTEGRLGELPDSGSEEGLLRLSPPPAKVTEKVTEKVPITVPVAPAPVVAARERLQTPPPAIALLEPSVVLAPDEPEQLTRPETVVSRRRAKLSSWPPPLPMTEHGAGPRTPRMGSMDVSVVAVPSAPPLVARTRRPSPPPLPMYEDLTERVPEVGEFLASEEDELPVLERAPEAVEVAPIEAEPALAEPALAEPALVEPALVEPALVEPALVGTVEIAPVQAALVEPIEIAPVQAALVEPIEIAPVQAALVEPALAEPVEIALEEVVVDAENESPALVIGVHVPDSEDVAEQVSDEDLETRPLPFLAPPMPYAGVPVQPTDVSELLRGFQVAEGLSEAELRRELKALAGVDLTPGSAVEVVPR